VTTFASLIASLERAGLLVSAPRVAMDVTGIADDSRQIRSGAVFCAVVGTVADGHAFAADAVARGAKVVVGERSLDIDVPQVLVRDGRSAAAVLAREWYGCPGDGLRIVGVTGTNGKTTTVSLVRHLLNGDGAAGSIGTLGAFDGAGSPIEDVGVLTTPGAVGLQAALAALRSRGVRSVVMEASSHALDQRRLETLTLEGAVYTNLSHDHMDYHPTVEAYLEAKARLSDYVARDGVEVVNADDPAWHGLRNREQVRRVSYGHTESATVRAVGVKRDRDGSRATFVFDGDPVSMHIPLLGDFNVTNALAASAAVWGLGMAPGDIAARLATAPQVPGRLEVLVADPYRILRDYAHTPDALERAIGAVRPLTRGRLIVLFGAGGDRDRAKRTKMGRAVARGADVAIVTSDNPRTEDPERILDDIEAGMDVGPHRRIVDRREAIAQAVAMLEPGDLLLLAGKGHETYQVIGSERHPFDEREIVRSALPGSGR
jgi:UDP-N-acetylmuramoyl-L-alanyl-D-glutamate--2,6-diaminopimelate ligase